MLPFLIYLNTLVYVPHYFFLLTILYAVYKKNSFAKRDIFNSLTIPIGIIVFLSSLNFLAHFLFNSQRDEIIPYTVLMFGTYLIALSLSPDNLKVLVYFTLFECLIGYLEFAMGVKTFFTGIETYSEIDGDSGLLYFRSVYGLSNNSSAFTDKIFLAYLLTYWIDLKGKKVIGLRLLFLGGILIGFNRTCMVSIAFFHAAQFSPTIFKAVVQAFRLRMRKALFYYLSTGILLIGLIFYVVIVNADVVINQLTRKTQTIELSGRDEIWAKFFQFIGDHLILGNGSFKYVVDYHHTYAHAHNSFLEVMATHGLIIFIFHIVLILLNIKKSNFIYVMTLLVFSVAQYGIFWGISITDIIFMVFLLSRTKVRFPNPTLFRQ